jgi:hypothetical protein
MFRANKNGYPYRSKSLEVGTKFCLDCLKHFEDCNCLLPSESLLDRKTKTINPIQFDDIVANTKNYEEKNDNSRSN